MIQRISVGPKPQWLEQLFFLFLLFLLLLFDLLVSTPEWLFAVRLGKLVKLVDITLRSSTVIMVTMVAMVTMVTMVTYLYLRTRKRINPLKARLIQFWAVRVKSPSNTYAEKIRTEKVLYEAL